MADKDAGGGSLRPNQVCARLDIQPYQLKFWESEFAELGRRVGARRDYDPLAVEIATDVKRLLVDGRMNIGEAREILRERYAGDDDGPSGEAASAAAVEPPAASQAGRVAPPRASAAEAAPAAAPAPDEALRRKLKRAEEAALQARQRASALEAEVEDLRRDAEENESDARRQLLVEKGRVTELTKRLDASEAKIAKLEERLANERERATSGQGALSTRETELAEARDALAAAEKLRDASEARAEALEAELLERARTTESLRHLLREEGGALEAEAGRLAALGEELLVSLSWAGVPSAESAEGAPEQGGGEIPSKRLDGPTEHPKDGASESG